MNGNSSTLEMNSKSFNDVARLVCVGTAMRANASCRWGTQVGCVSVMVALLMGCGPSSTSPLEAPLPQTFSELLTLASSHLTVDSIARMNLLCAQGLSATNEPDVEGCLVTLREWSERVRAETDRHFYRFRQNPAEFEGSEAFYRMLMLTVVLAEDFGVRYDAQKQMAPTSARMDDGFFADARNVFLHGLLGPERRGTCSSLPVLYVAIGRELGYPLKLVTTKGHLFVRWEDGQERFNVEATSRGLSRFPDDYYRHWPFEVSAGEEAEEGYLKSLTPAEELAVFLSIRGMCQREAGRFKEAAESFAAAARLAPACRCYQVMSGSGNQTARMPPA